MNLNQHYLFYINCKIGRITFFIRALTVDRIKYSMIATEKQERKKERKKERDQKRERGGGEGEERERRERKRERIISESHY